METTSTNSPDTANGQSASLGEDGSQLAVVERSLSTPSEPPREAGAVARAVKLALRVSIQSGRDAFTTIGHGDEALDQAVHAVRKNNKNAAAALWLLEPWVDEELRSRAEVALRRASRLLREPRRAVALTHTLRALSSDDGPIAPEAVEARLSDEREVGPELLSEVTRLLDEALVAVREFAPVEASDDDVLGRVKQAGRRLRQRSRAARRERSPKRLHGLRKALKRYAALHQALAPLVEGTLDQDRLEALATHLGRLNDLRDLRKHVRKARGEVPKRELKSLQQRLQKQQAKELRASQKLAHKLARKPRPQSKAQPGADPATTAVHAN